MVAAREEVGLALPFLLAGPIVRRVDLAWAIERRLESPLSDGIDVTTGDLEPELPEVSPQGDVPRYWLATDVPAHSIPSLPVRVGSEVRLARAALPGAAGPVVSRSRVLHDPDAPDRPLLLPEEEVPREGAVVRRAYQTARSADGRRHVSIGTATQWAAARDPAACDSIS